MPTFHVNNWYWKQYTGSTLFDLVKKWRDYTKKEQNLLLYGAEEQGGKRVVKQVEGIHNMMSRLLLKRDRGNTVLVVEHDRDVISIADEVIDVGPLAGKNGGSILYQGSFEKLLTSGTLTGNTLKQHTPIKEAPRKPTEF